MADQNKKIQYTIEINDKGKVKIDGLTKGFVKMDNAVKKVNLDLEAQATAANKASTAQKSMIATSGLAGATLTELGRTISDANYGIRGVANNLSQLSSLFITLVAKANGFGSAMKILKAQLAGPLGLILLFQTVVMFLERYSMNSEKAKKSTESFSGAISKSLPELNNYLTIIEDIALTQSQLNALLDGAAASDKKLYKFLKDSNLSQEERNEITKEYLAISRLIGTVEGDLQKTRDEIRDKGGVYTLEDIKQLENKIKAEEESAEIISGIARTAADQRVLDLKTQLEQAKENASEITALTLRESELFSILAKYTELQSELIGKGAKDAREKLKALAVDFSKIFFIDDEDGFVKTLDSYRDFLKISTERMGDGAMKVSDILKGIGRDFKDSEDRRKESLANGLAAIKEEAVAVSKLFKATQSSLGHINNVVMSYHDARIEALSRERDYVLNSGKLTGAAQKKAIEDIERRELQAQRRKIKAERDMFTIKQSLLIAEEIMKFKFEVAERKRKLGDKVSEITAEGITQVGKAQMSAGAFAAQGGPIGLATFAITIGGLIASILAARKKAQASLASLGATPSGGGGSIGGGVEAPDFNVVGASPESQLAQSVSQQQTQPLRAFVVHKDIKDANELDRNIDATRTLG